MDLKQLAYFVLAAESGSLSRAAAALGIAQSAMSRNLSALESELGGRIFYRTGRGMSLTELGEELLPKARLVLGGAQGLVDDAHALMSAPRGIVNVGLVPSVSEALVGRLFNQVQQQYPAIQLRIHDAYSGDINEWLASGKIDIGISNIYRRGRRVDNPLFESKLLLVVPAGDPLATRRSIKFESVVQLQLVLPVRPNALRGALDDAAKQIGMSIQPQLEVSSSVALKSAIIHSALYSVMPLHLIIQEVKLGIVVAVPITNPTLPQTLFISTNKSHALSVAARAILRILPTVVKNALKSHLAQ